MKNFISRVKHFRQDFIMQQRIEDCKSGIHFMKQRNFTKIHLFIMKDWLLFVIQTF